MTVFLQIVDVFNNFLYVEYYPDYTIRTGQTTITCSLSTGFVGTVVAYGIIYKTAPTVAIFL